MFENIAQNKISQTIIRQVREAIISGKLKPGDRLPPERKLLTQFGVSRQTLRESLRALESMGLIEIQKGAGGGPVVQKVDMQVTREAIANFLYFQRISIKDLSEVRKLIEPYLVRITTPKLEPEDLNYLESLNQACKDTLARGEEIIGGEHEIDFHIHLARKSGNPVLTMILDFVNKLLVELKLECRPSPEFSRDVIAAHDRILEALKSGDSDLAAQAMYEHVHQVEEGIGQIELGRGVSLDLEPMHTVLHSE
jgi:GntR family transcriptional repressor for pyruvate dehydrogenase complex